AQQRGHAWQKAAPATLADFLALRLFLARQFAEAPAAPAAPPATEVAAIWLEAWEESWRQGLTERLAAAAATPAPARPAQAQLVFCIDVRSEVLRRQLERLGPWETLGFAGFFGAAVAVQPFGSDQAYASCPVLLQPRHVVPEVPAPGAEAAAAQRLTGLGRLRRAKDGLRALKDSVAGAFGFVEATGAAFGAAMVARTVAPEGF
ncbi:putative inorganic carbon transporter subunit DabA, partial [Falsiroseomonas oryzae]|uniref:putative inorganic carbon transporter subunit DabA n=1 Tax=Falsiroseomonas oryzae TaxID=2766473 RepID=UPI0022EAD06D